MQSLITAVICNYHVFRLSSAEVLFDWDFDERWDFVCSCGLELNREHFLTANRIITGTKGWASSLLTPPKQILVTQLAACIQAGGRPPSLSFLYIGFELEASGYYGLYITAIWLLTSALQSVFDYSADTYIKLFAIAGKDVFNVILLHHFIIANQTVQNLYI